MRFIATCIIVIALSIVTFNKPTDRISEVEKLDIEFQSKIIEHSEVMDSLKLNIILMVIDNDSLLKK